MCQTKQTDLLGYHPKLKLTFNTVQIILDNARMNEQLCR